MIPNSSCSNKDDESVDSSDKQNRKTNSSVPPPSQCSNKSFSVICYLSVLKTAE